MRAATRTNTDRHTGWHKETSIPEVHDVVRVRNTGSQISGIKFKHPVKNVTSFFLQNDSSFMLPVTYPIIDKRPLLYNRILISNSLKYTSSARKGRTSKFMFSFPTMKMDRLCFHRFKTYRHFCTILLYLT